MTQFVRQLYCGDTLKQSFINWHSRDRGHRLTLEFCSFFPLWLRPLPVYTGQNDLNGCRFVRICNHRMPFLCPTFIVPSDRRICTACTHNAYSGILEGRIGSAKRRPLCTAGPTFFSIFAVNARRWRLTDAILEIRNRRQLRNT